MVYGRSMRWALLVLVAGCGDGVDAEHVIGAGEGDEAAGAIADREAARGGGPAAFAPPTGEPTGGEVAWTVSVPSAGGNAQVAVDGDGNIFVAATHAGAVSLGGVQVPAPASGKGLLVMKLTATGQPIWGRSVTTAVEINARGVAVTSAGHPVIAGARRDSTSYSAVDGFVLSLDGASGTTRWSVPLAGSSEDRVAGIAASVHAATGDDPPSARLAAGSLPEPGPAGVDAIYVYGKLGASASIAGHAFPAGSYLLRFDEGGALRWGRSLPRLAPDYGHALAVDPQRGPVIAGRFYGTVTLGSQVLTAENDGSYSEDGVVAGFDLHGQERFARQITPAYDRISSSLNVAIAPGGDIYFASDTSGSATVVDGHVIPSPTSSDHLSLVRLTPEGRYVSSKVITGGNLAWSYDVRTDAAGAVYLLGECDDKVEVQPEIVCASGSGLGLLASYGADGAYRWAIPVVAGDGGSIAPAPQSRLIVAGTSQAASSSLGLTIASVGRGAARPPSPLPVAPAISSVKLEGINDRELRHGGTATLVIEGTGLDTVTRARLGDLDVHVPAGAGTPAQLRLPLWIPNGHAPGWLGLELGNAGGAAQASAAVNVTPVVVSPAGTAGGRGTFASPMRLCDLDSFQLRYGDVLLLRNGVHTCNKSFYFRQGVIVRGESKSGTIVRGNGSSAPFGGFSGAAGRIGVTTIENLTIESASYGAISVSGRAGRLAVTDVDVQNVSASGIRVDQGAAATVTRYRFRQSQGTAIVIGRGHVDASFVEVTNGGGVWMLEGTLRLASSTITGGSVAVQAGTINDYYGTRDVTISNTTLRANTNGLAAVAARVTITGSTIEALTSSDYSYGVDVDGGELVMSGSTVRGWNSCLFAKETLPTDINWAVTPGGGAAAAAAASDEMVDAVRVSLDQVELAGCQWGVHYSSGWYSSNGALDSRLHVRRSRVAATHAAVTLSGAFAAADFGTAASPGDNRLETTSGEPALRDDRHETGVVLDARGTTLNGAAFTGVIGGPVTVPGAYHIRVANQIRF